MTAHRTAADLRRRGLRLEWATNAWNAMEVVVTITLGAQAGSLALIAFGLDSVVEIFASTVVIRNLHDVRRDPGDRRVHRSLRLIAVAFWVLAAFLAVMSVRGLVHQDRPDSAPIGIAYLAVTACVMFGLARLKRTTARALGWWWADPIAALLVAAAAINAGIGHWRESAPHAVDAPDRR